VGDVEVIDLQPMNRSMSRGTVIRTHLAFPRTNTNGFRRVAGHYRRNNQR
jgi:hypothetical protein